MALDASQLPCASMRKIPFASGSSIPILEASLTPGRPHLNLKPGDFYYKEYKMH
jgi:hypothetical protein